MIRVKWEGFNGKYLVFARDHLNVGLILYFGKDFDEAEARLEQGMRVAEELDYMEHGAATVGMMREEL